MNYITYLRVSDRHQVSGDGLDRQRDTISRWVKGVNGDTCFQGEFCENGYTGTDFDRPVLARLFGACDLYDKVEYCGVQLTVLVERSDRLARDNLVSELILQEFRRLDVKVIDCEADLDLTHDDDPSKVLIRQILQAVSQFDKSSIVKKLRRARERKKAKEGRCEGAKPFGYYPGEEEVLEVILRYHGWGNSNVSIATDLNKLGADMSRFRPRRGKLWNRGTIYKIIKANRK